MSTREDDPVCLTCLDSEGRDVGWFFAFPDETERTRELTRAERESWFAVTGQRVTHVRLRRVLTTIGDGKRSPVRRYQKVSRHVY